MDGVTRWVKLQVSDTPGVAISLVAIGFAVLGLCFSLFVRPRRVWVRLAVTDADGRSLVEVGGLDRADARAGLSEDVAGLADRLAERRGGRTEGVRLGMNCEYYSNVALVSSVVVYLLAMIAHAAEWAAARRVPARARRPRQAGWPSVGAPALAGEPVGDARSPRSTRPEPSMAEPGSSCSAASASP